MEKNEELQKARGGVAIKGTVRPDFVTDGCRHCGRMIALGPPTPDTYWFHPHSQSVYCWLGSDQPSEQGVKAAPR